MLAILISMLFDFLFYFLLFVHDLNRLLHESLWDFNIFPHRLFFFFYWVENMSLYYEHFELFIGVDRLF